MIGNDNGGGFTFPRKVSWSVVIIAFTLACSSAVLHYRVGALESDAKVFKSDVKVFKSLEKKICLLCTAIPGLGPKDANCVRICTE